MVDFWLGPTLRCAPALTAQLLHAASVAISVTVSEPGLVAFGVSAIYVAIYAAGA